MRSEDRRAQILEVARQVFFKQGLNGAKTKTLADAAGISEASIFRHFASKEELIDEAIIRPLRNAFSAQSQKARGLKGLTKQALREQGARTVVEGADAFERIFPFLTTILFSEYEAGAEFYKKHFYREIFKPNCDTLASILKVDDPEGVELLGLFGFGMVFALCLDTHFRGRRHDRERAAKLYLDLILKGPGHKQARSKR